MPCKIKIKQHVENLVDQKSQPGLSMSLQDAQILSANINSEFMHHVVSFKNDNGVIKRDINIPSPLVDMYYDLQVKKEIVNTPSNKNSLTLYHGTANVFEGEFDISKSNTSDTIFLTDNESFANEFSFNDEFRPNGVTYTVTANLEKTFNSNTDEAIKELEPLIRKLVAENYSYKTGLNYRTDLKQINIGEKVIENPTQEDFVQHYLWRAKSNWRLMESPRVIEYLKSKGYDSFTIQERGANNIAVFDKSKVKFEKYKDKSGKEIIVNNKQNIDDLNSDINSLNLTPEVVNYLYRSSRSKSKNVSLDSYTKEVKKLIDNLRTSYTNEEILEKIKCL